MIRRILLFAAMLAACVPALSQDFTTITAAQIKNGKGTLLTSGTLSFLGTDLQGNAVAYKLGGGGQVLMVGFTCSVVNGAIIGTCQTPNTATTNPSGICMKTAVRDSGGQLVIGGPGYSCLQPTGASFNFDNYVPSTPPPAVILNNSISGNVSITGNVTVTGSFTPGSFSFPGTVSGNLTGGGTATFLGDGVNNTLTVKNAANATLDLWNGTSLSSAGGEHCSFNGLTWVINCFSRSGGGHAASATITMGQPITFSSSSFTGGGTYLSMGNCIGCTADNSSFNGTLSLPATSLVINGSTMFSINRPTDTSPTGFFIDMRNAANSSSLASIDVTGKAAVASLQVARTDLSLANGANNDVAIGTAGLVKIVGPTGAFSISGFSGGADGRILRVFNSVAQQMTITNEAGSSGPNRIRTLTGADVVLRSGTSFATFVYESTTARWLLTSAN